MNTAEQLEVIKLKLNRARASSVNVTEDSLIVDLSDGRTISVPVGWFPRLSHGSPAERNHFEIIGEGSMIHWPALDEDIGVQTLLLGPGKGESAESLQRWLDARKVTDQ